VFDVNEDHLRELFSKFGTVTDVKIVRDPRGLSRGSVFSIHYAYHGCGIILAGIDS
jgi:hypothetical protein